MVQNNESTFKTNNIFFISKVGIEWKKWCFKIWLIWLYVKFNISLLNLPSITLSVFVQLYYFGLAGINALGSVFTDIDCPALTHLNFWKATFALADFQAFFWYMVREVFNSRWVTSTYFWVAKTCVIVLWE